MKMQSVFNEPVNGACPEYYVLNFAVIAKNFTDNKRDFFLLYINQEKSFNWGSALQLFLFNR